PRRPGLVGEGAPTGQGGGHAATRGVPPDGRQGRSRKVTAESPERLRAGGMPAPVAPSRFVRIVVRPMTEVLNPLIVRFADRRHFPMAAQIQHVGRSGKAYVTPATAHMHGDVILI